MADWVTKAEVKAYWKIGDTSLDTLIDANIPRAQVIIEQFILKAGQVYDTFSNVVEQLSLPDLCSAFFAQEHLSITTLSYVKENGVQLTEDLDFYLDKKTAKFTKAGGYWSTTPKAVEIKYSTTLAVPADVKLALIEYVGVITGINNRTYLTGEGVEAAIKSGIPQFVQDILNRRWVPRAAMING